ncbi:MAG: GIY-YIG nuclease family protein [Bacteroidota bacterium]
MSRIYYVYILASKRNGTLYIGVTNDLARRICEHREKVRKGFTQKYNVSMLVYYEEHGDIRVAIQREKQLKKWNRSWKLRLIEQHNPRWKDLWNEGEILPLPVEMA